MRRKNPLHSSNSSEWYTPAPYIERVREFLGGIDLDPASSIHANTIIKADRYFCKEQNGVLQPWLPARTLFCNPPYSERGGVAPWLTAAQTWFDAGLREQVWLLNATPDRNWMQPLFDHAVCWHKQRLRFYRHPTEEDLERGLVPFELKHANVTATFVENDRPTHGNATVYLGTRVADFVNDFSDLGRITLGPTAFKSLISVPANRTQAQLIASLYGLSLPSQG